MAAQQAMPPVPPPGQADGAAVGRAEQARLTRLHGGNQPLATIGDDIIRVQETAFAALAQGGNLPANPIIQAALLPITQAQAQLQAGQAQLLAQLQAGQAQLLAQLQAAIAQAQAQLQAGQAQLQAGQAQLQAAMHNSRARAQNARVQQDDPQQMRPLAPLVKQQPPPANGGGGAAAVGALPPANVFPATWLAVGQLSNAQLDALEAFYGEPFAGAVLAQRQAAFESFIKQ